MIPINGKPHTQATDDEIISTLVIMLALEYGGTKHATLAKELNARKVKRLQEKELVPHDAP